MLSFIAGISYIAIQCFILFCQFALSFNLSKNIYAGSYPWLGALLLFALLGLALVGFFWLCKKGITNRKLSNHLVSLFKGFSGINMVMLFLHVAFFEPDEAVIGLSYIAVHVISIWGAFKK